jgi:hypothetical protein
MTAYSFTPRRNVEADQHRSLAGCACRLTIGHVPRLGVLQDLLSYVIPQPMRQRKADESAKLSHRQCHLPLAPQANDSDDEETARAHRVRLLSEESDGQPRASEEEVAWRSRA